MGINFANDSPSMVHGLLIEQSVTQCVALGCTVLGLLGDVSFDESDTIASSGNRTQEHHLKKEVSYRLSFGTSEPSEGLLAVTLKCSGVLQVGGGYRRVCLSPVRLRLGLHSPVCCNLESSGQTLAARVGCCAPVSVSLLPLLKVGALFGPGSTGLGPLEPPTLRTAMVRLLQLSISPEFLYVLLSTVVKVTFTNLAVWFDCW